MALTRPLQRRNNRVEANLLLVDPLAARYARCTGESFEDLRQVGRLGLIRAAERYRELSIQARLGRPARTGELAEWLAFSLSELQQLAEERQRLRCECRGTDELERLTPTLAWAEAEAVDEEDIEALQALKRLEPKHRRVLQLVVLGGHSLREVAAALGISPATAHRWLHRGLEELRCRLTPASDARAW